MIFQENFFLMLYSINRTYFIIWLPLLLEVLGNMCIVIACFPGRDVMNFEINLNFLIKPFFYIIKKWRQKYKHLEDENNFKLNKKHLSSFLKGFSG